MKLKKRAAKKAGNPNEGKSLLAYYISSSGSLPEGYHSLLDSPEVRACVSRIAAPISSATIYLMRNTDTGDVRVRNRLSRFVDVTPWPEMGTRQSWMNWIVTQLVGPGDGNAFVLPHFAGGELVALEPMPGAVCSGTRAGYFVTWNGQIYERDEVLHFRLFPDPLRPWMGSGYTVSAGHLAASLWQSETLKDALSSPDYKPPLIVSVAADSDLSDAGKRDAFREEYLESTDVGKPWIIPAGLIDVKQVKPLTLTDLAIKDTVELDKRSIASLFGVPPCLLGVGSFDKNEYNNFIRSVIVPICRGIEQELTAKLLISEDLYFQFNSRRLYAYDMAELVAMDLAMSDRGFMTGDEVREDAARDPAGLDEFRVLENYIPFDMAGAQKKLNQEA